MITIGHLESPAHLCASLQVPYGRVCRAIKALGLEPVLAINGVDHFNLEQCEAIADHLKAKVNQC